MRVILLVLVFAYALICCQASLDWSRDTQPGRWYKDALDKINQMLKRKINKNVAKNIILFLGDGWRLILFCYWVWLSNQISSSCYIPNLQQKQQKFFKNFG